MLHPDVLSPTGTFTFEEARWFVPAGLLFRFASGHSESRTQVGELTSRSKTAW